jgi:hypothetical protein
MADSEGHFGLPAGTDTNVNGEGLKVSPEEVDAQFQAHFGTERQNPASCDAGPIEKRVKGVEPSTFTLATDNTRILKYSIRLHLRLPV